MNFYSFLRNDAYQSWFGLYVFTTLSLYVAWRISGKLSVFEGIRNCCNFAAVFLFFPAIIIDSMIHYIPRGVGYVAYITGDIDVHNFYRAINQFHFWLPCLFFIFLIPQCRRSWSVSLAMCLICNPFFDLDQFVISVCHLAENYAYTPSTLLTSSNIWTFCQRLLGFWLFVGFLFGLRSNRH